MTRLAKRIKGKETLLLFIVVDFRVRHVIVRVVLEDGVIVKGYSFQEVSIFQGVLKPNGLEHDYNEEEEIVIYETQSSDYRGIYRLNIR